MRVDGEPRDAPPVACPYLPDKTFIQNYFFGLEADPPETSALLAAGWRHFGAFFFRPNCPGCRACWPVRLAASTLEFTPSQRRVWRRNEDVDFQAVPLEYKDEYFELYQDHSLHRFGKETDSEEFRQGFFEPAVPTFLTEYRIEGELAALGFCDEAEDSLSSVYFVFGDKYADRSLGIYSILRECALAAELKKEWYYLGYWVQGNATMAYKGRFGPKQVRNWSTGEWEEK